MTSKIKHLVWSSLVWTGLLFVAAGALVVSGASPLLAWRDPIYIAAGFSGVFAMIFLLVQAALIAGYLPGVSRFRGRRLHRWTGVVLVFAVALHVVALWITSPPDVVDALLFRSPTPFSAWGVIAMVAVFAAALLAAIRRWMRLRPQTWRSLHAACTLTAVCSSVLHAMLIEGTMGPLSKALLCLLALLMTLKAMMDLRIWSRGNS